MHNHLYYTDSYPVQVVSGKVGEPGLFLAEIPYTAPRLYLAAGVTTMRTTGSVEPYADLKVKGRIDANLMPGPSIDVTAPYLEGAPTRFAQMHELTGPDDAKRMVDYWAAEGMTSYKAYMNVTREELGVAIQQAHAHKLKLTGHLCSVTWAEAIALGIDDLEHGPVFCGHRIRHRQEARRVEPADSLLQDEPIRPFVRRRSSFPRRPALPERAATHLPRCRIPQPKDVS
jgi:hypothetical protein